MGTALATVLCENRYKVTVWDIERDVVDGINRFHKNPRSLSEVELAAAIKADHDLSRAVASRDVVVFAVASGAVREVAAKASGALARNCVAVCVSKGLEPKSFKTMPSVLLEELGGAFRYQITLLSGPTFASELAYRRPTAAVLASERANEYSKRAMGAFSNAWFNVSETRDMVGVALAGTAKNALAIASGIMLGLGHGYNTYAWALTQGFREMSRLIWKLGGSEETVYGLAGFGDAIATCLSRESRNRAFGELLGKGKTVTAALQKVGETVEGIAAIESLHQIAAKERLKLPLLAALHDIVGERKKADKVFRELLESL
ncbi:MAG: NAD(P)H-dependent glycerol-3-phosphate dehydrogenase [Patescibacteria group bacterium]